MLALLLGLCLAACSGGPDECEEDRRAPSSVPLGIELAALAVAKAVRAG
jgi:hypothetical protein